jgi:hypothetical protein
MFFLSALFGYSIVNGRCQSEFKNNRLREPAHDVPLALAIHIAQLLADA